MDEQTETEAEIGRLYMALDGLAVQRAEIIESLQTKQKELKEMSDG
jgi:hypothetical protein